MKANIFLKLLGNKTEARAFLSDNKEDYDFVSWGRNVAEAVTIILKMIRQKHGRGVEYFVADTPIKGKT